MCCAIFLQTLTQATPLIFTGLAFTFAKKANLIEVNCQALQTGYDY